MSQRKQDQSDFRKEGDKSKRLILIISNHLLLFMPLLMKNETTLCKIMFWEVTKKFQDSISINKLGLMQKIEQNGYVK